MIIYKDEVFGFFEIFNEENGTLFRSDINGVDPVMRSFPELLDVGIMGHCNGGQYCRNAGIDCYQKGFTTYAPHMSYENFMEIVKQAAGKTFQIALGGAGDPNKHPQIEDILKSCRAYRIIPNMTTSGFLITDNEVGLIKQYCGAVAVSWYSRFMDGKESNQETIDAVERLVKSGCTTNIHYVVSKDTINEAKSNDQGRAYEYAWMQTLYKAIAELRKTRIVENSSLVANEKAWSLMDEDMQEIFMTSAGAAIDMVLELEPRMAEVDSDELTLEFQKDGQGVKGDVRDIVIKRKNIEWEIGLSIKHNHDAVKHSRLSHKLDFGNEWFGMPCSDEYWEAVEPVFDLLKQEKNYGTKWSEIADKSQKVYIPLLQAFIDEINRANEKDQTMPRKMIEYLIGIEDYYKVVSKDSKRLTMIHTFNMHDTLNKPAKNKVSAITVPIVKLPTRLVALEFKPGSDNTVEMYLDNGWQLSFRIHNASTKVEPSLKFDVQFVSMPMEVLNIECRWN